MLHQYFSITGSADTTGEEGKLEDDLAEDPTALAAAAAHASHTDLTALESAGTSEVGRLNISKGANGKALTTSDITSTKTATNHTNTVSNSSGRDRLLSLFYTPKSSVKDGSNSKPPKSSSTHDLAATDTTTTNNIRRAGSLLGASAQPMNGGDNSDPSTALATTTNTNHATISVKESKKKQEGIYVNYLRVGDIFIDLTTSGFPINLTNYKASVDPFYCRSDVLDWHSLILKIERHARRSVVRDGVAKSVSTIGNFFHLSSVTPTTTVSTLRQGNQQHLASISTRSDVFNPLSIPFTTSPSTLQNATNTELNALALSYLNGSNIDHNTLIQQQQDILHQQECKECKEDEEDLKMMILLGVKPEVKKASGKKTSAGVGTSLLSRFSRS